MAARVVLLRGINVGPNKRIAMPALREALTGAGFEDVRTYVQSGNIVLSSGDSAKQLGARCEELIKNTFGHEVEVVVRTRAELAEVIKRNPLGDVADDPKRYQVSFLSAKPRRRSHPQARRAEGAERGVRRHRQGVLCLASRRRGAIEAVERARGQRAGRHGNVAQLEDGDDAARDDRSGLSLSAPRRGGILEPLNIRIFAGR